MCVINLAVPCWGSGDRRTQERGCGRTNEVLMIRSKLPRPSLGLTKHPFEEQHSLCMAPGEFSVEYQRNEVGIMPINRAGGRCWAPRAWCRCWWWWRWRCRCSWWLCPGWVWQSAHYAWWQASAALTGPCLLTFCSVGALPSQLMLSCGPDRTTPWPSHHVIWDPPAPVSRPGASRGTPSPRGGAGVSPSWVSSMRRRTPAPGVEAGPRRSRCWDPSGVWGTRTAPPSGGGESCENCRSSLMIGFDNDTIYPYLSQSLHQSWQKYPSVHQLSAPHFTPCLLLSLVLGTEALHWPLETRRILLLPFITGPLWASWGNGITMRLQLLAKQEEIDVVYLEQEILSSFYSAFIRTKTIKKTFLGLDLCLGLPSGKNRIFARFATDQLGHELKWMIHSYEEFGWYLWTRGSFMFKSNMFKYVALLEWAGNNRLDLD